LVEIKNFHFASENMLKIKEDIISGIIAHAKKEAPIEACGYLAEKEGVIVQQYKMKNMDASEVHFTLDPEEQFEAVRDMRKKGFKLAAVYHSHPTTSAHPSQEDIRLAYDPDLSYVIVSLLDGSETLKSFKILDNHVEPEKIDVLKKPLIWGKDDHGQRRFYELPPTLDDEIKDLESQILRYKKGKITAGELKTRRVPFGVYAQRTEATYMVRIRIPGGCVTPFQFKTVARLAVKYGNGSVHITTRQGLQIHDVILENLVTVIRELKHVGLTSRGGGGNTVRNITASWDAGISTDEVFDVTPYALSLTSRLIAESDSWLVPRKFKISFSNSGADNSNASFNDLGFIARRKNGQNGFRVYVAGGMGFKPQVGKLLHDFLPAEQSYLVAKSVKQIFNRHGNRKNKHAARLRFLWNKLGEKQFVELYHQEFETLKKQRLEHFFGAEVENKPRPDIRLKPVEIQSPDFAIWKQRYVKEQKQPKLYSILLPIFLGNLKSEQAIELSEFLDNFGENVMRCTQQQNLSIRNIPGEYLGNVYRVATTITELATEPKFISNCIACTGAELCTLGICLSRGAIRAIGKKLKKSGLSIEDLSDVKLHISGCPDTCGLHTTADLGFYGGASRKNQIMYPAYTIVAGSIIKDGHSRLACKIDKISARDLPDLVVEFLKLYLPKKENYSSFAAYIDDGGEADIRSLCNKYRDIPDFSNDKTYYFDWEAKEVFSVIGMGMGECSAGLFDLIDIDREIIKKQQRIITSLSDSNEISEALYKVVLSASRMLLITRGIEARSDRKVFQEFGKHFIETGMVDGHFKKLVKTAKNKDYTQLRDRKHQVYELASTMEKLSSMDDSLHFPAEKERELKPPNRIESVLDNNDDVFRDYRGVACPMNFVKVKLDLAMMESGQLLKVLLDDGEPIANVPRSVADEGHEIVKQKNENDFWSVLIRKV
jgi:sulfite reductase (ferredoxin)